MKQRKIAALLMALLSLSLLAGCGTTKNNELKESVSSQGSETIDQISEADENAEGAVEMLRSMVSADIHGEDAVSRYAEHPDETSYDCSFAEGLVTLIVNGRKISGKDSDGNELFSHTYHYIGMEDQRGLYEFESDDADSGEFTYFYFAPDTPQETYHIEFRYGYDKSKLGSYDSGNYAYWLPSGISADYDQKMVEDCIQLFCAENHAG